MAPPRSHRRATRPIYPGVMPVFIAGILGFLAYRLGYRLPWHTSIYLKLVLEGVVVYMAWKALKSFRGALKAQLRLFNAQSMIAYAVALQAVILLLPS